MGSALRGLVWSVTLVAALLVAPPLEPFVSLGILAPALGVASGGAGFLLLARRSIPYDGLVGVSKRRLLARSLVLTLKSAHEEALWRGVLLGTLAGVLGRAGALLVSTAAFAAAHTSRQGRGAAVHLLTGSIFGATYVVTGSITAAIGSHVTYNVLVGAALLAEQDLFISTTGGDARALVRSRLPQNGSEPNEHWKLRTSLPAPPVAGLEAVRKAFGGSVALDGVDLELRPGEILGVLGPNGAGKTTAVSLLLGLRRPDDGRALLFGRDPREPEARMHIGVVLQDVGFPPTLRVREVVDLVRAHFPERAPRDAVVERLGLGGVLDRQAGGLSGGERRRLALALALTGRPQVLFLDEPTAGVDASGRRALWRELSSFAGGGGAVLLTTQQLEEAEQHASRIVVLVNGRVVVEGRVQDVRARVGKTRVSFCAPRRPEVRACATVESTADRHVVYVDDADEFVADLVRSGTSFRGLEIAPVSLEEAFVALTGPDS